MRQFSFSSRCYASLDLDLSVCAQFLEITRREFQLSAWLLNHEPINVTEAGLRQQFAELRESVPGIRFGCYSSVEEGSVHARISSSQYARNLYYVNFSRTQHLPEKNYFRSMIELTRPYEAVVSDIENTRMLEEKFDVNKVPRAIHWLHYLNKEQADKFGGIEFCLKAPVFKAEQFCDGVLLQLCEEPFDNASSRHFELQAEAMDYFGLP